MRHMFLRSHTTSINSITPATTHIICLDLKEGDNRHQLPPRVDTQRRALLNAPLNTPLKLWLLEDVVDLFKQHYPAYASKFDELGVADRQHQFELAVLMILYHHGGVVHSFRYAVTTNSIYAGGTTTPHVLLTEDDDWVQLIAASVKQPLWDACISQLFKQPENMMAYIKRAMPLLPTHKQPVMLVAYNTIPSDNPMPPSPPPVTPLDTWGLLEQKKKNKKKPQARGYQQPPWALNYFTKGKEEEEGVEDGGEEEDYDVLIRRRLGYDYTRSRKKPKWTGNVYDDIEDIYPGVDEPTSPPLSPASPSLNGNLWNHLRLQHRYRVASPA